MNVIAQIKEDDRTQEQRKRVAHFEEYGCGVCHQIVPGKMGLTKLGSRLASLHAGCVEVEKIMNGRKTVGQ